MKSKQMICTQVQNTTDSLHTFCLGASQIARSQPPGNSTHTLTKKKTGGFYLGPKEFPKGGNVICWTAQMHARRTNAAPISLEARMATSRALAWGLGLWHHEARRPTQTGGNQSPRRGSGGRLQSLFFSFWLAHIHTHSVEVESLFAGGGEKSLSEQGLGRVVG